MKKILDYISIIISTAATAGISVLVVYFMFVATLLLLLPQAFAVLFICSLQRKQKDNAHSEKRWLTIVVRVWAAIAVALMLLLTVYVLQNYGDRYGKMLANYDCFSGIPPILPDDSQSNMPSPPPDHSSSGELIIPDNFSNEIYPNTCNPPSYISYVTNDISNDIIALIIILTAPFVLIVNPIYVAYRSMKRRE